MFDNLSKIFSRKDKTRTDTKEKPKDSAADRLLRISNEYAREKIVLEERLRELKKETLDGTNDKKRKEVEELHKKIDFVNQRYASTSGFSVAAKAMEDLRDGKKSTLDCALSLGKGLEKGNAKFEAKKVQSPPAEEESEVIKKAKRLLNEVNYENNLYQKEDEEVKAKMLPTILSMRNELKKYTDHRTGDIDLDKIECMLSEVRKTREGLYLYRQIQGFLERNALEYFTADEIAAYLNNNKITQYSETEIAAIFKIYNGGKHPILDNFLEILRDKHTRHKTNEDYNGFEAAYFLGSDIWKYYSMDYERFIFMRGRIKELLKQSPNKRHSIKDLTATMNMDNASLRFYLERIMFAFENEKGAFQIEIKNDMMYCYYSEPGTGNRKTAEKNEEEEKKKEACAWNAIKTEDEFYKHLYRKLINRFLPRELDDPDLIEKTEIAKQINFYHSIQDLEGLKALAREYTPDWEEYLKRF